MCIIIIITKLPNFPIKIKHELKNNIFQKAVKVNNYERYCVLTCDTHSRRTTASTTPGTSNFRVKLSQARKFLDLETQWTNTSDMRLHNWTSSPNIARKLRPFVLKVKQSEATAISSGRLDPQRKAVTALPTSGQHWNGDTAPRPKR